MHLKSFYCIFAYFENGDVTKLCDYIYVVTFKFLNFWFNSDFSLVFRKHEAKVKQSFKQCFANKIKSDKK